MPIQDKKMSITVIRPLQTATPTTVSPGYYLLNGVRYYFNGTQWYRCDGLMLVPLAVGFSPLSIIDGGAWTGTPPAVMTGDKFRVTMTYKYQGPAVTNARRYVAWGSWGLRFDAKLEVVTNTDIPASPTSPTTYTFTADFTVPSNVNADWTAVYFKIDSGTPSVPEMGISYSNAVQILLPQPTITDVNFTSISKV